MGNISSLMAILELFIIIVFIIKLILCKQRPYGKKHFSLSLNTKNWAILIGLSITYLLYALFKIAFTIPSTPFPIKKLLVFCKQVALINVYILIQYFVINIFLNETALPNTVKVLKQKKYIFRRKSIQLYFSILCIFEVLLQSFLFIFMYIPHRVFIFQSLLLITSILSFFFIYTVHNYSTSEINRIVIRGFLLIELCILFSTILEWIPYGLTGSYTLLYATQTLFRNSLLFTNILTCIVLYTQLFRKEIGETIYVSDF